MKIIKLSISVAVFGFALCLTLNQAATARAQPDKPVEQVNKNIQVLKVPGLDPEQTDFEDYREVDGVKLPFIIRGSYLDDNHLGRRAR